MRQGARHIKGLIASGALLISSGFVSAQGAYEEAAPLATPSISLSLDQAVSLTLQNNRDIKSIYLDRLSDKFALYVARDLFVPDAIISADAETADIGDSPLRIGEDSLGASVAATTFLPGGGTASIVYDTSTLRARGGGIPGTERFTGSNVTFAFVQPLLRGGGFKVARSPLALAEINERGQILGLKSLLIDTVTSTVIAYRNYLLEERQLAITERSLTRARELVTTTRALIDAGRLAELDLIQAETTLAERELELEGVRNSTDAARLSLLNILDIGLDTQIDLTDNLDASSFVEPPFGFAYDTVLDQQPGYLQTLLGLENTEIDLRLARNNRLWDLDAEVSVVMNENSINRFGSTLGDVFGDRPDVRAGLRLSIPLGDRTRRQSIVSARIAQRQQELQIEETLDAIRISLQDQLRTIASLRKQIGLAMRAEDLAQQQLELEKVKLNLGRTTNFQVTEFEDQLIAAQLNTASITASYLNAATSLEQFMGITLDTWQIALQVQRYGERDVRSQSNFGNVSVVN